MNQVAEYQKTGCWINETRGLVLIGAVDDVDYRWVREGDWGRQTIAEIKADPAVARQLCLDWLAAAYERYYDL